MSPTPQPIFSVLAEGGSLSISRVTVNGQYRFLTDHHEMDFSEEGLDINQTIGYASFEEAFLYISKYPWHLLYLRRVHQDYRIPVLDQLMKVLNGEPGDGKYYQRRNLREHQELLSAAICRDASGAWSYTLEDNQSSSREKTDYEK